MKTSHVIIGNKLRLPVDKQAGNTRYCARCHSKLTYRAARFRWYCPVCRQFTIGCVES